jgi:hypothetical protein
VDIADVLLDAYQAAVAGSPVACHLPVSLLAAIGQVESGSLAGRPIDAEHRTSVLGPVLDGNGFAAIPDTEQGRWDGDTRWDRAVGPMQFIPGTWRAFGADGDGDGVAHPQDVEDAAAGAAAYLCYGARDLSRPADLRSAILSYNHSDAYLQLVTTYQQRYASLGLDGGAPVTGLPTSISLIATPVGEPGRWKAAEVVARENARALGERTKRASVAPKKAPRATRPKARPQAARPKAQPTSTAPKATPDGSQDPQSGTGTGTGTGETGGTGGTGGTDETGSTVGTGGSTGDSGSGGGTPEPPSGQTDCTPDDAGDGSSTVTAASAPEGSGEPADATEAEECDPCRPPEGGPAGGDGAEATADPSAPPCPAEQGAD